MNRWLLLVAVLPLLAACASIPTPESPDDSLVIGYFALDFPDGFFAQSRRTFTSGIGLLIKNETTGRKFRLTTSNGYFQFLSNGTDGYTIMEYSLKERDPSGMYSVGGKLDRSFSTRTRSVVYLGHQTIVYSKPKNMYRSSGDSKENYWNFEKSNRHTYNEGQLLSYLVDAAPESPWLQYEVVH